MKISKEKLTNLMLLTVSKKLNESVDKKMLKAAESLFGEITPEQAEDAFVGKYRNDVEFAKEWAEMTTEYSPRDSSWPTNHIDWKAAAAELLDYDITSHKGYYFFNNW